MEIRKTAKIELCASGDSARPHLNHMHLDVEKSRLVATNGHMLAVVPVSVDESDTSGLVSADALKQARKLAVKTNPASIAVGKSLDLQNGASLPRPDLGGCNFPPYEKVIPSDAGDVTIGLDAKFLWDACQALGGSKGSAHVRITFKTPEEGKAMLDPLRIESTTGDGFVVLMPVRVI